MNETDAKPKFLATLGRLLGSMIASMLSCVRQGCSVHLFNVIMLSLMPRSTSPSFRIPVYNRAATVSIEGGSSKRNLAQNEK